MDMEAAMKIIRKKGQAVAAKRSDREARYYQGMIFIRQHMESCLILWWNCFMRENRSI